MKMIYRNIGTEESYEMTDIEEQKWKRIRELYDTVDANRRTRASKCSLPELTRDEQRELDSNNPLKVEHKNKMYQLTVVEMLDWSFEGVTRLNYNTSNQNIAHIVLRNHEREFEWKKIPFKPKCYIYNDVWKRMCEKAAEMKNKISDEWEMFDRYDGSILDH